MTPEVAVVGFAQSPRRVREDATTSGVEMLVPIFAEVFGATGLTKADIGFWCSGARAEGFSNIEDVLSFEQRKAIVRGYAATAGFAREQVNRPAKAA